MNKNSMSITTVIFALLLCAAAAAAPAAHGQVATGGAYSLTQTVMAGGGGTSADAATAGGTYTLSGTAGQAIAGTRSSVAPYSVIGGFWTADLAPTAAAVSVAGRVLTPTGRALKGARVTIADAGGNHQTAVTGLRGSYRFAAVRAGESYVVTVISKRYEFAPQVITVTDERENLDFSAQP